MISQKNHIRDFLWIICSGGTFPDRLAGSFSVLARRSPEPGASEVDRGQPAVGTWPHPLAS